MRKKEMTNLLAERAERILLLEQRLESKNQVIDSYRTREQAIVESLASSQTEARERIASAQAKADALTKSVEAQAQETLSAAQFQASELMAAAQAQAEELLASARAQSAQAIEQARLAAEEYERTTARYNALVSQTAAQMRERAEQFAAFIGGGGIHETGAAQAAQADLPDAQGDPARLMQNIYTLQNRSMPASVQPAADAQAQEPAAQQHAEPQQPEAERVQPAAEAFRPQPDLEAQPSGAAAYEEEVPDLAPRPETDWQPEDEVDVAAEWQPEAEPELEIPTVSELMPDMPGTPEDDELSLDALLDEIIKAGE